MGIKKYIENKKAKNNKETDIVTTLDSTIKQLEDYLWKLKTGQIHDVERYKGSRNGEFAESMIQHEIVIVSNSIQPLKDAKATITRGRVAEQHFHYDLTGTAEMGDDD